MSSPIRLNITASESRALERSAGDLLSTFQSTKNPEFYRAIAVAAQEMPRRIRRALTDFKLLEPAAAIVLGGIPIDDERIGPTPNVAGVPEDTDTQREDVLLLLLGTLLGDPIAWSTQQHGQLLHNVVPLPGREAEQTGAGSRVPLAWHTEEAFHPHRADYLGLLCLRNPDGVATTLAQIDDVTLSAEDQAILRRPLFPIRPDEAHRHEFWQSIVDPAVEPAVHGKTRIDVMDARPEPVAVIFGHQDSPYLRIDPYYMTSPREPDAVAALARLCGELEANLQPVVLGPGDVMFVDNYRAVHGRAAFQARYDGGDRWLKRINITRDLRKTRHLRAEPNDRVIS